MIDCFFLPSVGRWVSSVLCHWTFSNQCWHPVCISRVSEEESPLGFPFHLKHCSCAPIFMIPSLHRILQFRATYKSHPHSGQGVSQFLNIKRMRSQRWTGTLHYNGSRRTEGYLEVLLCAFHFSSLNAFMCVVRRTVINKNTPEIWEWYLNIKGLLLCMWGFQNERDFLSLDNTTYNLKERKWNNSQCFYAN